MGSIQKSQSCWMAQPPTNRATPVLRAGLTVKLVAPSIIPRIDALSEEYAEQLILERRGYEPDDLAGVGLLFVATDQTELNREIADQARGVGVLMNLADDREGLSDFILPAVVDRSPVIAAVATGARSPALAMDLLGPGDSDAFQEGVHPTDLGFTRIADRLEPLLREVLGLE